MTFDAATPAQLRDPRNADSHRGSPRARLAQATAHADLLGRLQRHGRTIGQPAPWLPFVNDAQRAQRQSFVRQHDARVAVQPEPGIFRRPFAERARAVARLAADTFIKRPLRPGIPLRSI